MATRKQNNTGAYGLYNAVQELNPLNIIAKRNPTTSDKAELGTIWINTTTDDTFIYTSNSNWSQMANTSSPDIISDEPILILSSSDTDPSVTVQTEGGTTSTLNLLNSSGTAANSILIDSTLGGVSLETHDSTNGVITITSSADVASGLALIANGGTSSTISILNSSGTDANSAISIGATTGGITMQADDTTNGFVTIGSAADAADSLLIVANGGTSSTVVLNNITGTSYQSINLDSTLGGISLRTNDATNGFINIVSNCDDVSAMVLSVEAGTASTLEIINTTGTSAESVSISSTLGGILLDGVNINVGTERESSVTIGNITGASSVDITSGTGGIVINSNSTGDILLVSNNTTAAAFAVTNNAIIGTSTLTGQTINAGASQAITLNNTNITTLNSVMVTVTSLNTSTNGAYLRVDGIIQNSGSLTINVTNPTGANLDTTDTITITFMVLG